MMINKNVTSTGNMWSRRVSEQWNAATGTWGERIAETAEKWKLLPFLMGFYWDEL